MKSVPLKGSPPMPTTIDWPRPCAVVWLTASYVSVPERDTMPMEPAWSRCTARARARVRARAAVGFGAAVGFEAADGFGLRLQSGLRVGASGRGCGSGLRSGVAAAHRVDVAGHDADLALAGLDDARAVGPDQARGGLAHQRLLHPDHVVLRHALGDAHLVAARGAARAQGAQQRRPSKQTQDATPHTSKIQAAVGHPQQCGACPWPTEPASWAMGRCRGRGRGRAAAATGRSCNQRDLRLESLEDRVGRAGRRHVDN
eukprot:scaffold1948_cov62-Phaeocystis_antarctica.AAC.8